MQWPGYPHPQPGPYAGYYVNVGSSVTKAAVVMQVCQKIQAFMQACKVSTTYLLSNSYVVLINITEGAHTAGTRDVGNLGATECHTSRGCLADGIGSHRNQHLHTNISGEKVAGCILNCRRL